MMAKVETNPIPPIPQSIDNSSKRSVLINISGITEKSQQIVVVSPAAVTNNVLNRNHSTLVTSQPTAEDKIRPAKRIRSNESRDESALTISITGSESQSEQQDSENGVESKQHRDHQTGSARQIQ